MLLKYASAADGIEWFKQGIRTFLNNPTTIVSILFSYLTLIGLLSSIPYIGKIIPSILAIFFSGIFFIAGREAQNKNKINVLAILQSFWKDFSIQWPQLLTLSFISFLFTSFGILIIQNITNINLDQEAFFAQPTYSFLPIIFLCILVLIPGNILFWFSPTLILWEKIGIMQAVFYSTVAFIKNILAYLTFAFCWLTTTLILIMLSWIPKSLHISNSVLVFILLTKSIILLSAFYSSLYSTYEGCFEKNAPQYK